MNQQNNVDDSMNFSVIDKNTSKQKDIDFSVQSLLENNQSTQKVQEQATDLQTTRNHIFDKIKQMQSKCGKSTIMPIVTTKQQNSQNFLKDLSRMEKELSFQTESYNVYEDNPSNSTENVQNINKSKTLSYLKVTKDTNKSISKDSFKDFNDYYGHLIIDFHIKHPKANEKIVSKKQSRNVSNNIQNEHSQALKEKSRKNSKSKGEINPFFRLKQKKSTSKSKFTLIEPRKSKSKSLTHKFEKSKSKSHLKSSTQAETFQEKVFTQYYGTDIYFKPKKYEPKKKECLATATSRSKSGKQKLGLLSPRQNKKYLPGKK